jgi:rubrerythrin
VGAASDHNQVVPSLFSRLFGKSPSAAAARVEGIDATFYPGDEPLEVVGESGYQDALWRIVGGRRREPVRYETEAVLEPEPGNPYDPNAIKVLVDGNLIGYLSRDDAAAYLPGLLRLMAGSPTGRVALEAQIVGGGPRRDGIGFLGVFLDHDPADFGLTVQRAANRRSLRTGFSDAMVTDLDDDKYDLSWYGELSENDVTAIKQLRSKLETERDPIDRHYMLCELEKRLYKSRDAFASALDEFDAVCRQHNAEMDTIRPALVDKFGVVPVIEMYRQAAVRCQKAKDWQTMREWVQRGISVYGEQAARAEAVEDLHKRLGYATTKIEAANRPKPRKPRAATVTTASASGGEVETLVCASCGTTFERVRTRGRKPGTCPACRGLASPTVPA